jgi:hypothetical protein
MNKRNYQEDMPAPCFGWPLDAACVAVLAVLLHSAYDLTRAIAGWL